MTHAQMVFNGRTGASLAMMDGTETTRRGIAAASALAAGFAGFRAEQLAAAQLLVAPIS